MPASFIMHINTSLYNLLNLVILENRPFEKSSCITSITCNLRVLFYISQSQYILDDCFPINTVLVLLVSQIYYITIVLVYILRHSTLVPVVTGATYMSNHKWKKNVEQTIFLK